MRGACITHFKTAPFHFKAAIDPGGRPPAHTHTTAHLLGPDLPELRPITTEIMPVADKGPRKRKKVSGGRKKRGRFRERMSFSHIIPDATQWCGVIGSPGGLIK
jgi:hypothetical protein